MKVTVFIVLFFGTFVAVSAQDIQFRVVERTPYAFDTNNGLTDGELEAGQIVVQFVVSYDIGLVREPGWFPHKSCIFSG